MRCCAGNLGSRLRVDLSLRLRLGLHLGLRRFRLSFHDLRRWGHRWTIDMLELWYFKRISPCRGI